MVVNIGCQVKVGIYQTPEVVISKLSTTNQQLQTYPKLIFFGLLDVPLNIMLVLHIACAQLPMFEMYGTMWLPGP